MPWQRSVQSSRIAYSLGPGGVAITPTGSTYDGEDLMSRCLRPGRAGSNSAPLVDAFDLLLCNWYCLRQPEAG
jgi:hypothetical protein